MRAPVAGALRRTVVAPLVTVQRGTEQWRVAWRESERLALGHDSLVLAAANANAPAPGERPAAVAPRSGQPPAVGVRARGGAARHGPAGRRHHVARAQRGQQRGHRDVQPGRRPRRPGRAGAERRSDDEHRHAVLEPGFPRERHDGRRRACSGSSIRTPARAATRYLLELRGVAIRSTLLKPGTQIITSGLGGVFPRGIPVGRVVAGDQAPPRVGRARTCCGRR